MKSRVPHKGYRILIATFSVILIVLCIFLVFVFSRNPSLNRNWAEESKVLPLVTIDSSKIYIENIRDWRYATGTAMSKDYYNETFDLNKLESTYFVISTFGPWVGIAHTFLVFDFSDGKSIAMSMEARREVGVPYSTLKGAFNNYEQWYAWGSAADFISRRVINFGDPVYMYPLNISASTSKALFLDLAKTTDGLETTPKFYNTIFSNCTNILAYAANRVNKGSIPWSIAGVFPGFSDDKLYELNLIPHDKPFAEVMFEANLNNYIRIFHDSRRGIYGENDFWHAVKRHLGV
jgi:hypothetical protein